jgi:two-component system, cell cycle sensor histidine kinase and response regulator CckA
LSDKHVDANGKVVAHRNRIRRRDAVIRWIEDRMKVVTDGTGKPIRLYGLSEDITDRLRLEDQLRESQKMEAVGPLAGGVAHDFNHMLTVITSYGEMLLDDLESDSPHVEAVQQIAKAAEHAESLTRQLLAFSRRQVVAPKIVELNTDVEQLSKMFRRLIGEDVRLRTALRTNLGKVKVDSGQIE